MKKLIFCLVLVVAITNTGVSQISKFIDKDSTCSYFRSIDYSVSFWDSLHTKYTHAELVDISSEIYLKDNILYIVYSDSSMEKFVIDQSSFEIDKKDEKSDQYSWFALDKNGVKCMYTYLLDKVKKQFRFYIGYYNETRRYEISYADTNYKIK